MDAGGGLPNQPPDSEEPPKGPVLIGLRSRKFLRVLSKQKLFISKAFKILMIRFHYAS